MTAFAQRLGIVKIEDGKAKGNAADISCRNRFLQFNNVDVLHTSLNDRKYEQQSSDNVSIQWVDVIVSAGLEKTFAEEAWIVKFGRTMCRPSKSAATLPNTLYAFFLTLSNLSFTASLDKK